MLLLHTDSLKKYGINRIFEFAQDAGYDGVEVGVIKNNFDTQNAQYLKALSETYDIPILALETPDISSQKSVEHVIDMAAYLKCPTVVINPPRIFDFRFISWLKKGMHEVRRQKKINCALLNASNSSFLGFLPAHAMSSVTDLKEFKMVALDTSATASKHIELIRIYERLKKYIVHIHLSNIRHHKEYSLPNEGILPIESLLKKLKENDYQGNVSLLVQPNELFAGDDDKVIKTLKKVKAFYEEYYKK
ncbi:sugar phosphate isomerase/epimerase [Candidatus Peregrinibacteria bacterium]|nr:sugar phosphate isomerase/epimerase [Candidatus Peregrinibacteria bacterium]